MNWGKFLMVFLMIVFGLFTITANIKPWGVLKDVPVDYLNPTVFVIEVLGIIILWSYRNKTIMADDSFSGEVAYKHYNKFLSRRDPNLVQFTPVKTISGPAYLVEMLKHGRMYSGMVGKSGSIIGHEPRYARHALPDPTTKDTVDLGWAKGLENPPENKFFKK